MDTAELQVPLLHLCIPFLCSRRREGSFHTTTLLPHLNNFHSVEHRLPGLEIFPGEDPPLGGIGLVPFPIAGIRNSPIGGAALTMSRVIAQFFTPSS